MSRASSGSEKNTDGLKELLEDYLDFQVNMPNSEKIYFYYLVDF